LFHSSTGKLDKDSSEFIPNKIHFEHHYSLSFSSIARSKKDHQHPIALPLSQTQKAPLSSFSSDPIPAGAETGQIIHKILERSVLNFSSLPSILLEEIKGTLLEPHADPLLSMLEKGLRIELPTPTHPIYLADLPTNTLLPEMEFVCEVNGHFIKGLIDLVYIFDNRFYLLDWKSNLLESYDREELFKTMEEHHYFLQADLYAEALCRYFRFKAPHLSLGGIFYVFLRGPSLYSYTPGPITIASSLDKSSDYNLLADFF